MCRRVIHPWEGLTCHYRVELLTSIVVSSTVLPAISSAGSLDLPFYSTPGGDPGAPIQTPINVFRGGDGYRIALTYGAESDWVRNVLAAGGCEIESQRRRIVLTHPRIVSDPSRRWAPPVVRQVIGMIGASQYMQLTVVEQVAG